MKFIYIWFITLLSMHSAYAADSGGPDKIVQYKVVGDVSLTLHIFNPANHKQVDNSPAIVFFFGGGWNGGTPGHFYDHSRHLAARGMVAIAAEYRINKKHKTSPIESVKDAITAMRWVRSHANELGINPNMIAAGGGSAGGHLATATATLTAFVEADDDTSVSYAPNALVLFNPVIDNSKAGYGYERVKPHWQDFSPLHNLNKDVPPTVMFLGTKDKLIPVATAEKFKKILNDYGIRCDLHLYEDQPHGFFNKAKKPETIAEMDKFLTSLGYIPSQS